MKKRDYIYPAVTAVLLVALATTAPRTAGRIETRTDTLVVRDTVRDTILVPVARYAVRTDTVWLMSAGDTVRVEVEVPVGRKVYETPDYRAVVEGFRPALTEMEIYRNTVYVNRETVIRPPVRRWGIGVQTGWGYCGRVRPYIGVGVQYSVITF